jgi:hypothetical protein
VKKDVLSEARKENMGVISKAVPSWKKGSVEFYLGSLYIFIQEAL